MKRIHAMIMALLMLLSLTAPAQDTQAAGKSFKQSQKAFFKEMKQFDYRGMNKYVKKWGNNGQAVSAFYAIPSARKYFSKCAKKMTCKVLSTEKERNKAKVKVRIRYASCEDFALNFCVYAFYYMADGRLDNLSSMSEKEVIELADEICSQSAKGAKLNTYKTKTVTICFVKTKSSWKVQKVSDKLADCMMAGFISNLGKLAEMSLPQTVGAETGTTVFSIGTDGNRKLTKKEVLTRILRLDLN